jgi:hypothetical protein
MRACSFMAYNYIIYKLRLLTKAVWFDKIYLGQKYKVLYL